LGSFELVLAEILQVAQESCKIMQIRYAGFPLTLTSAKMNPAFTAPKILQNPAKKQ
jgi:hypothetical protein